MSVAFDSITSDFVLAARQGGAVAKTLQGRVSNEGKDVDVALPNDHVQLERMREAKTVVDEAVQEILILAALRHLDPGSTAIDAEEASNSRHFFFGKGDNTTLVIDPIDGTLEYIEGLDDYSICAGLVRCGELQLAVVYFPIRDHLYFRATDGVGYKIYEASRAGIDSAEAINVKRTESMLIYVNGRVPEVLQDELRDKGFEVVDDLVDRRLAPDCIIACMEGRARAYVAHTRQVRDVLLGGILAGSAGGSATDWNGEQLVWPQGGRVARAAFSADELGDDVVATLAKWTE